MKSTIFWDITPCSPLKVKRRFGGIYRLHFLMKAGGKDSQFYEQIDGMAMGSPPGCP
jgi:hypothetical protein